MRAQRFFRSTGKCLVGITRAEAIGPFAIASAAACGEVIPASSTYWYLSSVAAGPLCSPV